ncbi:hypothetical protein E3P78_03154 [Wallemia ichthyophaga]|nr:hypothetical protein E3P78_03154 [Wallemia ichthyophaga]
MSTPSSKKSKARYSIHPPWGSYAPAQLGIGPSNTRHPHEAHAHTAHTLPADPADADHAQILIPYLSSVDLARRANIYPRGVQIDSPSRDLEAMERWLETHRWSRVSSDAGNDFLPNNPPIHVHAGSTHSTHPFSFPRFHSNSLEHTSQSPGSVFNAGGCVMGLDWQRRWREVEVEDINHAENSADNDTPIQPSILAVSVLNNNSTAHGIGAHDRRGYKSAIQLWGYVPRHKSGNEEITPCSITLLAVICHSHGVALDVKFSPTDAAYMEYGDQERERVTSGALAATYNDGQAQVMLIPDLLLLRRFYGVGDSEVLFLNPPASTLVMQTPPSKGLTCEWASSNRLAVGFSNGALAVYDLRAALRERRMSIRPSSYIDVHMGGINGMQWVAITPHEMARGDGGENKSEESTTHKTLLPTLSTGPRAEYTQLLTSAYDGSICITDVRLAGSGSGSGGSVTLFDHIRGVAYTVGYSIHLNAMVSANGENTVVAQGLLASDYKRGSQLTDFACAVLSIATSTCHPFVAVAGSNGHVEVVNPLAIVHARSRRLQVYYSMDLFAVEFGRSEELYRMIDHLNPPSNRDREGTDKGKGNKVGNAVEKHPREELGKYAAPFPAESAVRILRWNPDSDRAALLASGMACGLVRVDELWDVDTTRFGIVLGISCVFFVSELVVGLRTRSLALIADSFHYLSDLVAYVIAFTAAYLREHGRRLPGWTYGWHRAELVGAFFNGVFLLGLALSIFLQSIERFFNPESVDQPIAVISLGGVGLVLNIISAAFVHDHGHGGHGHSHGKHEHSHSNSDEEEGLLSRHSHDDDHEHSHSHSHSHNDENSHDNENSLHHMHNHVRLPPPIDPHGDLVGVLILKLKSENRFYADPAASLIISIIIFASAIPLTLKTARILLEVAPKYLDLQAIESDLLSLPNVVSIHDHHIWHLSQTDLLATLHVRVPSSLTLTQWHTVEREMLASVYWGSLSGIDGQHYTRTIGGVEVDIGGVGERQNTQNTQNTQHTCSNPFSQLGTLHVNLTHREENNWVPFDSSCQPPRLMASLAAQISGDTLSHSHTDTSFAHNKTILIMGDSIARETVKYFCNLLGEDVVNLGDDHPWSPFAGEGEAQTYNLSQSKSKSHSHGKRAPRESSLPNICYIPSIDLMLIQSFHFGMDTDAFFASKEQYNPPNNYEDRLIVHGRNILDRISMSNTNEGESRSEGESEKETRAAHTLRQPDLVEVSSSLWDLARFARIDIEDDKSTMTDLSGDRLAFYMDRMSEMLSATQSIFPSAQLVWRTCHYPSESNHKLDWIDWIGRSINTDINTHAKMARLEQERLYQDKPYFHLNRLFQLDQAARYVLQKEEFDGVGLNEWGRLMFGQHAHQIDQLHPSMLPGGWLWGDTMLYELRKATLRANQ